MQKPKDESIFTKLRAQQSSQIANHHRIWLEQVLRIFIILDVFFISISLTVYMLSGTFAVLLTALAVGICLLLTLKARQLINTNNYELAGLLLYGCFMFVGIGEILLIPDALPATLLAPLVGILTSAPYLRPKTLRWAIPLGGAIMLLQILLAEYVVFFEIQPWISRIPLMIGVMVYSILLIVMFKHYHDLVVESQQHLEETLLARTAEVREREQLFQAVSNLTSDFAFIMHVDASGVVINEWENETISALTGYRAEELRARGGFASIIHPDDRVIIVEFYHSLVKGQRGTCDCRIIHANNSIRWLRSYAQPVLDQETQRVTHIFGAMQDITASKEHQQQIAELAFYDPLTGLSNRRLFHDRINALLSLANDQPFAVLFLDLDRFKRVNDTLGHNMGDELLMQVAKRLQTFLRPGDTFARLGGDEFAVLLLNTHTEQGLLIAQRLLAELETPFLIENHHLHIGGSIGLASYPKDGSTLNLLLKHADIAMYHAKAQGSQVICYDEVLFNVPKERLEFEAELRYAIDHDQLVLFFQPIHDLYTGDLVRAEVLVRWQHPEQGLLLPGSFIHIAEECGLIRALDRWVLYAALKQCAIWDQAGTPMPISVNMSAQLLADPLLIEEVQRIIQETGVPTSQIMVEITETAALQDLEMTIRVLEQFKALGMIIALDDFGTGHASLGRLKLLPVNVLKIDHEFTAGIRRNLKDEGVLQAVVALAQGLQLTTIVEGIETTEQHEWLCNAGFEQGQGFLLARPMSAEHLIHMRAYKPSLYENYQVKTATR